MLIMKKIIQLLILHLKINKGDGYMNQQGFIIEVVDKKTAKMIMQRHSACASCGKCTKLSSE